MPAVQDFNALLRALRTDTPPPAPIAAKWLDTLSSGLVDAATHATLTDEQKAEIVLADVREYFWGIYSTSVIQPAAAATTQAEQGRILPDRGDINAP